MIVSGETSVSASWPMRVARWALVGVEGVVAAGAAYGGVGLIAGNAIHISDDWLVGTPFDSWLLPGIFLLLVVAVPRCLLPWSQNCFGCRGPTGHRCWRARPDRVDRGPMGDHATVLRPSARHVDRGRGRGAFGMGGAPREPATRRWPGELKNRICHHGQPYVVLWWWRLMPRQ